MNEWWTFKRKLFHKRQKSKWLPKIAYRTVSLNLEISKLNGDKSSRFSGQNIRS